MAKAKLTAAAVKWVGKKGGHEKVEPTVGKVKQTIYVSEKVSKLLWQKRVDSGVPISRTIEDLVLKHLG